MSQTLIIHNDTSLIDVLRLNLNVYVGTDIILKKSFKEAEVLMRHHPGIDLIICKDVINDEATAESTIAFYKNSENVPMIVLGEKANLVPVNNIKVFTKEVELKTLVQTVADFLRVSPRDMVEKIVPDFFPLDAYYCLNLNIAPCDIFISNKTNNYVLEFKKGSFLDTDEVLNLIRGDHQEIYVHAEDRIVFVNTLTNNLNSILSDDKTDPKLKISAVENSLSVLQEEVFKADSFIEKSIKTLAMSAINTCMEIAQQNPRIAALLRDLLSNRTSYRYKHVQMNIYVCNHIVSNLEWGSNEVKEKLAFVAFFHDIYLTDDKLAEINWSNFEETEKDLNVDEREMVLNHARYAAEIVQKFPRAPIGSDVIIFQHHGMLRGQGFSQTFSNDLSPLAIIFIIAEEFSHMVLLDENIEGLGNKKEMMIKSLYEKFPRSKYAKIINALESISF